MIRIGERVYHKVYGSGVVVNSAVGQVEVKFDYYRDKDGNLHPNEPVELGISQMEVVKTIWLPVATLEIA